MNRKIAFSALAALLAISSAYAGNCQKKALTIVSTIINETDGAPDVKYIFTDMLYTPKSQTVSIHAYGLGGQDSDSSKDYALTFRISPTSKSCGALESVQLTAEN